MTIRRFVVTSALLLALFTSVAVGGLIVLGTLVSDQPRVTPGQFLASHLPYPSEPSPIPETGR